MRGWLNYFKCFDFPKPMKYIDKLAKKNYGIWYLKKF